MSSSDNKDFSQESIKKAVLKNAIANPLMVSFVLVGSIGLISFLAFNLIWLAGIGVIGFSLLLGTFVLNYYGRRAKLEEDYIKSLNKKAEEITKSKLSELDKDLDYCLNFSDNDPLVSQAKKQFQMINDKFNSFKDILGKKFSPNELTYGLFYTTAEQTHGAVLDNLEKVVMSFKVLKDIDLDYLESRYDELKQRIDKNMAEEFDKTEFNSVQERIDMREKKFYEIDSILSKNEEAMAEMTEINLKLSDLRTQEGRSNQDLDATLRDLDNLAKNASQYEL